MRFSVVIPALNEERNVGSAVRSALDGCPPSTSTRTSSTEVIVVDGRSRDGTVREARRAGASVLRADTPGRAPQMNQGAKAARGDVIMFLHADSMLPNDYKSLVNASMNTSASWGCFRSIDIGIRNPLARFLIKQGVALRTKVLHKPYGDQCIFVKQKTFDEIGGYRDEMRLMEDVDLVSRLRAHAGPPAIVERDLKTSGRRWERLGIARTTILNQFILLRYAMGADVNELATLYASSKNR